MKTLLIIDDNAEDRLLYRRLLRPQEGQERLDIHEASDGEQGLARFRELHPDCVLLDYNLPDTDGLSMLAQMQQETPLDTLCVVMITGGGNEQLAVRALRTGALDYLVKGQFDHDLLDRTVRHAIEKNEWRQYQNRYHAEMQTINRQLRDSLAELTHTRQALHNKNTELMAANDQVTARNQQLARSNQDLDNFVYAASHDLKQPVNNLQGLFEELRCTMLVQEPDTATIMRLFEESLQSLSTTINDLAAVVQEQRPASQPPSEPIDLAELATDVMQALRPQILATHAHINTNFSGLSQLQYVRVNLRTILLNLLGNALKYRHPGRRPHIQLRAYAAAGQPVLEVQDNGLGINIERHGTELFQLFRRFHPQAGDGTGVGLFLVNRLVQGPGGHIEVESKEDHGTTFRLFLQAGSHT
ncbi:sensor histidine kinase [Hymenobacter canadensis]|uniref:histidine kinase n=1 Tax=Hymenobacter canadensis TaxID=2999067 RepID=A0ABY7LS94_9BACT|nr:response regulator [Hymenobacter canadensis]WBA43292.1 response regulator [Hymenobacter canadensis]